MTEHLDGLTTAEVNKRIEKGHVNRTDDAASPSYLLIALRNTFNLINVALLPLLLALAYFGRYKDVFVMSTFLIINSLLAFADEARIKHRLDKIRVQYATKARVIRDGHEQEIPASELVKDDVIKVLEGESIPVDGEILHASSLQLDESLLTGESNYLVREPGDEVIGGSFVVTGECIYRVTKVGKDSYINKMGSQSKTFRKERSDLQKIGDILTVVFVVAAVVFGALSYLSAAALGYPVSESIVPLTSAVSLIIPQTLIFLFTFTFSISTVRLSGMGALVRRGSAVESLAKVDVLCFDKTGTITSGEMSITNTRYWNTDEKDLAAIFQFVAHKAFGRNKTFNTIVSYFEQKPTAKLQIQDFTQIPFNSKIKHARNLLELEDGTNIALVYGAASQVLELLEKSTRHEVAGFVSAEEATGRRIIVGVTIKSEQKLDLNNLPAANSAWVISMREQLTPHIAETIQKFHKLGTELKIISGDSFVAIRRILDEVGMKELRAVDLSSFEGDLAKAALEYDIFARAKPENKLTIIQSLQGEGMQVGMVGDGVNDVLALKLANLSIAVESGAKIAREVADIVLLKNNFALVPHIISEGENVIANLKFMNLLFLTKTIHAAVFVLLCALTGLIFPVSPSSILVYSFMATSLPSYVIAFFRRKVQTNKKFWSDVLPSSLLAGTIGAATNLVIYISYAQQLDESGMRTLAVYGALGFALLYAVYQLYSGGFVKKWWQLVLSYVVISLISFLASQIPFINVYYDLNQISVVNWLQVYAIAAVGFGFYFVSEKIFRLIAAK